ncbi:AraC family transcriptional regulator [Neisseria dumasiana]|uniref:AraC family transcriptional regulator n=1 Tax=Neisseria dumasiana TaxID=1931275 RepID=UPI000A18CD28|nr:cupin domain-containing protein [Neisseria dumasiana]OSI14093.1 AraC family transcriptional regulator [Neisseria dumasiana]
MDIFDKLVELAQIKGSVDVQCRLQGSWYVRQEPKRARGLAHIVTEGEGYLRVDGEAESRLLTAGDIVFFPRIAGHTISSSRDCNNTEDTPYWVQSGIFTLKKRGSQGRSLNLFCARFEYDSRADLIDGLPEIVHLNIDRAALQPLTAMLEYEAERSDKGSATVVNALSSVLLVMLMRAYLVQENRKLPAGTLNGWHHPRLRAVVQAVLTAPEKAWSVQEMAAAANVSRAQLMRLFKQQIGVSPHAFVNSIRLQQAAVLLKQTADSILSVALSVGFQSETHFGKTFKKQYGVSPGQYRKNGCIVQPSEK